MIWRALIAASLLAPVACKKPAEPPAGPIVQVLGDTAKVRRGEPPPRSAIFDGRTVSLRAARGETLGLQVVLYRTGPRAVSLSLEAPGVSIEPFEVDFARVREPSSSLYGRGLGRGVYPDRLRPAAGPVTAEDAVFLDVAVARDAAPGRHRGELAVGADRFAVDLVIEPAEIDLERAPLVWVWFHTGELTSAHRMADGDGAPQIALERSYMALFRRHGALLASDYSPDRLRPRLDYMTDDVRYWPVRIARRDLARRAADVAALVELFRGRRQTPFTFTIDEPKEEQREQVRADGLGIRAAGGGAPRLLYAVTDQARPIYRGAVDVFVSPASVPPPAGYPGARFWTYNGRSPSAGNMTIDKPGTALRTWGWVAERYAVELWYAWEGLYFTDRYNRGTRPTDLMNQPLTYDERRRGGEELGNGDGLLAYPGPLPSLRLKALRRGLQDRLLLRSLAGCGEAGKAEADRLVRRMIPRALGEAGDEQAWPDDEVPWEEARRAVLDGIRARCAPAAGGPRGD